MKWNGLLTQESPPIEKVLLPFRMFIHNEVSSGVLLMLSAGLALIWANSPWTEVYTALWETELSIQIGEFEVAESLLHWINDGLMAIFFFVVGLEIKRELLAGELASPRLAALPLVAALGGMAVPAMIYAAFNAGTAEAVGWGIPMATDIAFSLGVLYLLGDRVPASLRIFLASLAIVDDLGAVVAIAFFYTSEISYLSLAVGAAIFAFVGALNRLGVRNSLVYGIFGIGGVWLAFLFSGVHPTIAGVLMAMLIPANIRLDPGKFVSQSRVIIDRFEEAGPYGYHVLANRTRQDALLALDVATDDSLTPLQRLESALHPWVSVVVLPVFALANAGVVLDSNVASIIGHPVTLGIVLGLVVGKQIGVTAFSWLAVRLGLAQLPDGVRWTHVYGVSCLAGVGFTMSLFIGGLAFQDPTLTAITKIAILGASSIAGVIGVAVLIRSGK